MIYKMIISEFKISNILSQGVHKRDVLREDNIKSHSYTVQREITHIGMGSIYIEIII